MNVVGDVVLPIPLAVSLFAMDAILLVHDFERVFVHQRESHAWLLPVYHRARDRFRKRNGCDCARGNFNRRFDDDHGRCPYGLLTYATGGPFAYAVTRQPAALGHNI
jgi:hypothetical protein